LCTYYLQMYETADFSLIRKIRVDPIAKVILIDNGSLGSNYKNPLYPFNKTNIQREIKQKAETSLNKTIRF
jgi:hypothetical protein